MDFSNPLNQAEAYRLGQRHGFIAGIIVSAGSYYLVKAYKPTSFRMRKNKQESPS